MNKLLYLFFSLAIKRLQIVFLILLFGIKSICFGQEAIDVPEYYFNQFNTFLSTNSASIIDTSKLELGSFYSSFSGGFSKIRNFEAYAIYRPSQRSSWLVEFNSDQQGPVFQKNRFYVGHMQRIALNKTINLQLSAKLGIANYSFKQSSGGVGGSDSGLDGAAGLSLFTKKWLIGSSLHQFPSTELRPINQIFSLSNYWEFHGYYLFGGGDFQLKTGIRSRVTKSNNTYQLSTQANYYSLLLGSSISNLGYSFSLGYHGIIPSMDQKRTMLSILYLVPNSNNLQSVNHARYELVFKFFIL